MTGGDVLVLDIDDTLADSIFKNLGKDEKVPTKETLDKLSKLVPYPLVKKEIIPIVVRAERILIVTGRQQEMASVTKRWLRKTLGTNDFSIKFLHYQNYDQYIEDKKKVLRRAFADFDDLAYHIIMYEDNDDITRWVKMYYGWVELHKVKDANATKV